MIAVSDNFKNAMKEPIKQLDAYIKVSDEESITASDDLISFKISCEAGLCKTAMRKLEASYLGEHNLLDLWVKVGFGVKITDDTYEYLDYGSFLISEISTSKDTGVTTITGYDKMISSMTEYEVLSVEYPIELYDYTKELCTACGLELGNTSFETHGSWELTGELWENIDGITYRDIFVQIAQATASTCMISNDDKVYFKPINATGERLDYDNLLTLTLEPQYGEINSVVLSRTPAEDNIYMRDETSIEENGLTEFKIENNEIIDKNRDNAMTPIYEALYGIKYYPFEATTEGHGWYEIADNFNIVNDTGDTYNTTLFNYTIQVTGGIKESLSTEAETQTQTQYQYATTIAKRVKNTEIIVDKQEQNIQQIVSDLYQEDGIIQETITQIYQDINGITSTIQITGGSNLINNSVKLFGDDLWENSETGTFSGGYTQALVGKTVSSSKVQVSNGTTRTTSDNIVSIVNGETYTLSYKASNDSNTVLTVRLIGNETVYEEVIEDSVDLKTYTFTFVAETPTLILEISSTSSLETGSSFVSDLMLAKGDKTSWEPAVGEVNSTVMKFYKLGLIIYATGSDTAVMLGSQGLDIREYDGSSVGDRITYFDVNGLSTKEIECTEITMQDLVNKKMTIDSTNYYVRYIKD